MTIIDRYLAYADAFEESYEDDDWSHIEPFFTEQAVYEGGPEAVRGRAALTAKLKSGVDAFDRKMDSRKISFQASPEMEGDTVTVNWKVAYTLADCPDLVIFGREIAVFDGDQISSLRDEFDPAAEAAMGEWITANGARLQA